MCDNEGLASGNFTFRHSALTPAGPATQFIGASRTGFIFAASPSDIRQGRRFLEGKRHSEQAGAQRTGELFVKGGATVWLPYSAHDCYSHDARVWAPSESRFWWKANTNLQMTPPNTIQQKQSAFSFTAVGATLHDYAGRFAPNMETPVLATLSIHLGQAFTVAAAAIWKRF